MAESVHATQQVSGGGVSPQGGLKRLRAISVASAKAGAQGCRGRNYRSLDTRFRGYDGEVHGTNRQNGTTSPGG